MLHSAPATALASARQRPLDEIQIEYEITKSKYAHGISGIVRNDAPKIDKLLDSQKDFMGSTWQLRYGKVVGDYFGVDPAFGAMLNPTGGLVGAGNGGLDPNSPFIPESVAYHGAYHDAVGYLNTYHRVGPGYDYVSPTFDYWRELPIAGQVSGVAAWTINLLGNAGLAGVRY